LQRQLDLIKSGNAAELAPVVRGDTKHPGRGEHGLDCDDRHHSRVLAHIAGAWGFVHPRFRPRAHRQPAVVKLNLGFGARGPVVRKVDCDSPRWRPSRRAASKGTGVRLLPSNSFSRTHAQQCPHVFHQTFRDPVTWIALRLCARLDRNSRRRSNRLSCDPVVLALVPKRDLAPTSCDWTRSTLPRSLRTDLKHRGARNEAERIPNDTSRHRLRSRRGWSTGRL
jgi:hypothetical protein